PKDITEPVPDPNDAPYAGLLFLSSGYLRVNDNQADKLRVTLGIVGPSSGAGSTQRFIHKVVGANRPEGWDYQIKDEPVGNIERIRIWRFESQTEDDAEADLLVLGGLSLGNLESSVGASVIARYGSGLKRSFGTASQITG